MFIEEADLPVESPPIRTHRDFALALLADGERSVVVCEGPRVIAYIRRSQADPRLLNECRADAIRLLAGGSSTVRAAG